MYSSVLKRAEKKLDEGKTEDADIVEYVLGQNITDEEAWDILTYLGLSDVLSAPERGSNAAKSGGTAGNRQTMERW